MKKLILVLIITLQGFSLQASKGHLDEKPGHDHEESSEEEKDSHDDHSDDEKKGEQKEDEHGHADEGEGHADEGEGHGDEEEEESSAVGPNKGITEKSKEGIKLSASAWKLMGVETSKISSKVIEISYEALVEIKNEKSIYRIRNSWIKKAPIKVLKKNGDKLLIEIIDFREGDLLVISGVGFIRTAEIVAEQGAASGHSH